MKNFVCPARDPNFARNNIHGVHGQRESYRQALKYTKQRRTAIDAGAHIGIWTDLLATDFQRVVAFEASGENYRCLVANISDHQNVTHYRGALVGPVPGEGPHFLQMALPSKGNSGMWAVNMTVYGADKRDVDPEQVPAAPLDSFDIVDVDMLKIDVEGFEGHVIRGAKRILTDNSPIVIFEDNGLGLRYFKHYWIDPKPLLLELGYRKRFRWIKDEIWSR